MPPPVEEEDESDVESQTSSDNESIPDGDVDELAGARDPNWPDPVSTGHGTGVLVHSGKWKVGLEDDGPPSKAQRTDAADGERGDDGDEDEVNEDNENDENEDDEEDDEDETENGEDHQDIPNSANYAQQSFSLSAAPVPDAAPAGQPSDPPTPKDRWSSTMIPTPHAAALAVYRAAYPHLRLRSIHPESVIATLASAPNQVSYLMQATGDEVPKGGACEKRARNRGVYIGACVVVRDSTIMGITG
ncbi:hypothetical protein C8A05DRAFT_39826, partial [Staphylotrichum tortipilum]